MKKKLLVILALAALSNANAQAVEKGNIIIDAYYGGPQIFSLIPKNTNSDGNTTTFTHKGFGPIGGRVEYMISKRSSLAVDVNMANSAIDLYWNDGQDPYRASYTLSRLRVMPRYALHFGGNKLDVFWHVGLGLARWAVTVDVTDPSNTFENDVRGLNSASGPGVAFRTGIGFRYFFTKNIGINADFGLGGPLLTGGLTVKL